MTNFYGDDSLPPTNIDFNRNCLNPTERREALDKFARLYMAGLASYLRATKQVSEEQSEELVNTFLHDRIPDVISKWDSSQPFRPWLKTCVRNFANDQLRKWSKEQHRRRELPEDLSPGDQVRRVNDVQSEASEVAAWLQAARETTERRCQREGPPYPQIFADLIADPLWKGTASLSYREIAQRCGLVKDATHYIRRARTMFMSAIEEAIGNVSELEPEQVEDEVERIRTLLFNPGQAIEIIHALRGDASRSSDEMETIATLFIKEPAVRFDVNEAQAILNSVTKMTLRQEDDGREVVIADVIADMNSSYELWKLLKRKAKTLVKSTNEKAPREVLTVLYLASIAAGILKGRRDISRKPDSELRDDFRRALGHTWLSPELKQILREGLDSISI